MAEFLRSAAARWALGIALWSVGLVLAVFAFVYWQTAAFLREELAETLRLEIRTVVADPAGASTRVDTWTAMDVHATHYGGLFGRDGARLAGDLDAVPAGLARDGDAYRVAATVEIAGRRLDDEVWAAALALPDGRIAVIAHDTDEIDRVRDTSLRALGLGLAPALLLSGLGGLVLAARARRRLAATEAAVARVARGDLRGRLPADGRGDEFDRLASGVNRMLDEIERLMGEVRGVGDAVAHDLRTPLTRLRARLERTRAQGTSVDEFRAAIDQGLAWIDQTLAMVSAVLRIGEIEDRGRRAGFAPLDLGEIVREAVEFFEPVAEERGIGLRASVPPGDHGVVGDCDLVFEAVTNLLDNALKFTPPGGTVEASVGRRGGASALRVADTGPGIPPAERARMFERFQRGEAARRTSGNGLGLSLVAAVAALHGGRVAILDAPHGGCSVEVCFAAPQAGQP